MLTITKDNKTREYYFRLFERNFSSVQIMRDLVSRYEEWLNFQQRGRARSNIHSHRKLIIKHFNNHKDYLAARDLYHLAVAIIMQDANLYYDYTTEFNRPQLFQNNIIQRIVDLDDTDGAFSRFFMSVFEPALSDL